MPSQFIVFEAQRRSNYQSSCSGGLCRRSHWIDRFIVKVERSLVNGRRASIASLRSSSAISVSLGLLALWELS